MDVIANQLEANITNGGVGEFQGDDLRPLPRPVVALQGSGTADAPYLVINLGHDRTIQRLGRLRPAGHRHHRRQRDPAGRPPVSRRWRRGNWTNIPAGFVADATTGPSLATLVTPVSVALPSAADDQATRPDPDHHGQRRRERRVGRHRRHRGHGIGTDEAPAVKSTTPDDGAVDVALDADLSVTFSEPVDVTGGWFDITCATSSNTPPSSRGGPVTFSDRPGHRLRGRRVLHAHRSSARTSPIRTRIDPPEQMAPTMSRRSNRSPAARSTDGRCRRTVRGRRRRERRRQCHRHRAGRPGADLPLGPRRGWHVRDAGSVGDVLGGRSPGATRAGRSRSGRPARPG